MAEQSWNAVGLMSGTSLDGLDLAACQFTRDGDCWKYRLVASTTALYTDEWTHKLSHSMEMSAVELVQLDADYGKWMGNQVKAFIAQYQLDVDFIASHGHTVFHRPGLGFSTQIGHGAHIAAASGKPVICDFRSSDVALGGQGAPLVPIGDALLFSTFQYCLNLGGVANISFDDQGKRVAFDICPANMVLNYLANKKGLRYDEGGKLASSGEIIPGVLSELNSLPWYRMFPPKSLGREWFQEEFLPIVLQGNHPIENLLRTCCEHISYQVAQVIQPAPGKILVTGGGAWNHFLVDRIREKTQADVVVPDRGTVDFKEAIIFAFLGVLRWLGEPNCLESATGARKSVSGGCIYLA